MHLGSLESSQKLELLSAVLQATLTHFSSSPNFLRASITRYKHAKHEQILKFKWHRLQVLADQQQINKEGKFLKELWCWVRGRV